MSTKKTLMNKISVSFYCIDLLIALEADSGSLIIKNLFQHIFGHRNLLGISIYNTTQIINAILYQQAFSESYSFNQ